MFINMAQRDKIKTHVNKHKEAYVVGGVCLFVGVTTGYVFRNSTVKATIDNRQILSWKPINTSTNIITSYLNVRGYVAKAVRCLENDLEYSSQIEGAEAVGATASNFSKHMNGRLPHINGFHFEYVLDEVA
jgi:hypothetical protein